MKKPTKTEIIKQAKSLLTSIVLAFLFSAIISMAFYVLLAYSVEEDAAIDWSGFFAFQFWVAIALLFVYGIRKVQKGRKQLKFRDGKLIWVDRKLTWWERLFSQTKTLEPEETKGG